jgi:hypothetical protein
MTFVLVIGYAPYSKASRNKPNKAAVSIGMPMVRVVPLDQLNEIQIGEYPGRFTCTETQTSEVPRMVERRKLCERAETREHKYFVMRSCVESI